MSSSGCQVLVVEIDREEVWDVDRSIWTGKMPGSNGLPAEFNVTCWNIIGSDFLEMVRCCFENMRLCASQALGIVKLLPKPGNLRFFSNWSSITLLNEDYKIISKLLANQIWSVVGCPVLSIINIIFFYNTYFFCAYKSI